jgi:hypothetical protein
MSVFDDTKVQAAIARLPSMSSKDIRDLRSRATSNGLEALVLACDTQLQDRPFDLSADVAASFEMMADHVKDLTLVQAIRHAFSSVRPANADEARALRWIADHPGGDFQTFLKAYGKGDLSLVIGHLVYDRFGCFRQFMTPGEDQSSVLLHKDRSAGSVRYTLRQEAAAVFQELGVIA